MAGRPTFPRSPSVFTGSIVIACAAASLLAHPARAQETVECTVTQVTSTLDEDSTNPTLSVGSPWMTFNVGPGFQGNRRRGSLHEVFAFHRTTGETVNLTATPGYDGNATISGNGQLIVFESESSLTGPNPEGNRELVLLDRGSDTFVPVTDSTEQNYQPRITTDGTRVLFTSTSDYVGENPIGVDQIFEYDVASQIFDQVTHFGDFSIGFAMNPEGTMAVFATAEDLVGGNPDGNDEVFLLDVETEFVTQITSTAPPGLNIGTGVSADGDVVLLFSSAEELIGPNPSGLPDLLVYHRSADVFEQLTFGADPSVYGALISGDGHRVVALINDSIILYDLPSQTSTLIAFAPFPLLVDVTSINLDGTLVGFHTDVDLTGQNPEHNIEVFVATCPPLLIFADGFESGSADNWSAAVGLP